MSPKLKVSLPVVERLGGLASEEHQEKTLLRCGIVAIRVIKGSIHGHLSPDDQLTEVINLVRVVFSCLPPKKPE